MHDMGSQSCGREPQSGRLYGMSFGKPFVLVVLGTLFAMIVAGTLLYNGGRTGYARGEMNPRDPSLTLSRAQELIAQQYPVPQATPQTVAATAAAGTVALFDVRTAEEFEKGHIDGAVRVDPGMSAEDFFATFGLFRTGKPAIFYCSVGYRSSDLVARLVPHMKTSSPIGKFNLSGGAFRWVYEGRELVSGHEPGELHPFNVEWSEFLSRLMATKTAVQ